MSCVYFSTSDSKLLDRYRLHSTIYQDYPYRLLYKLLYTLAAMSSKGQSLPPLPGYSPVPGSASAPPAGLVFPDLVNAANNKLRQTDTDPGTATPMAGMTAARLAEAINLATQSGILTAVHRLDDGVSLVYRIQRLICGLEPGSTPLLQFFHWLEQQWKEFLWQRPEHALVLSG